MRHIGSDTNSKMQQVTTTFTRVYGAIQFGNYPKGSLANLFRRGPDFTLFGFDDASGSHYNVRVPGYPTIESGMTVTALLEQPNDWSLIAGWVNHSTGEITYTETVIPFSVLIGAATLLSFLAMLSLASVGIGSPTPSLALLAVAAAVGAFYTRQFTDVKNTLFDIATSLKK